MIEDNSEMIFLLQQWQFNEHCEDFEQSNKILEEL